MKRFTKLLLLAIMLLTTAIGAVAKSTMDSYYMQRASEEMNAGNVEAALSYFQKELEENPTNAYAHMGLALIYNAISDYDNTMASVNAALKHLPKKDTLVRAIALNMRAGLYAIQHDECSELADLNEAIRVYPDYAASYLRRAAIYCDHGQYDEAQADYTKALQLEPDGIESRSGLALIAYRNENYSTAINLYSEVLASQPDNYDALLNRGKSYFHLGEYEKSIDDICYSIVQQCDESTLMLIGRYPAELAPTLIAKLVDIKNKNPYVKHPYVALEYVYSLQKQYTNAIVTLKNSPFYITDGNAYFSQRIGLAYFMLNDYATALPYLDQALAIDPEDDIARFYKALIYGDIGREREAIALLNECLSGRYINPDYFYHLAFFEARINEINDALRHYDSAIQSSYTLSNHAYAYLGYGDMLERLGRHEEALEAYQRVVQLDTVPNENSCAMYALLALNRREEAVAFMQRLLEALPDASSTYYDAACFYCRLGQPQQALQYLATALEKGFRRFYRIRYADELAPVRQLPEFESLMQQYEPAS